VRDNKGEWLARGIINQQAQIALRLMTWQADTHIDETFWQQRVAHAVARRYRDPLLTNTNARRLIFGESDGLPGVIADDYAGHIVLELSTLAAVNARDVLIQALRETAQAEQVVLRSDEERLKHEFGGSVPRWVSDAIAQLPSGTGEVAITEHGLHFIVNLASGQKTGFYLDQRENRLRVAAHCNCARVLNVFSYTGAFAAHALAAGASHVTNVDSSADALALAEKTLQLLSHPTGEGWEQVCADAFEFLRAQRAAGAQYDVVILDPPKFAHHVGQVERAARAYKDLNRVGLALVKPGGILATFSCSGVVDAALFQKIIFSASVEARRDAQIVERLTQASDHPVLLSFPESDYLKGLILRVA
jgi:23S rRNA (cytosine1962-C5)-methyltransferase